MSTLLSPAVTMTVPVQQYWPLPMPGVEVTSGPTAEVDRRWLHHRRADPREPEPDRCASSGRAARRSAPSFLPPIAGLIALVCFQLLRGAAFAPVVARAAILTAGVVLVGGLGTQLLCDIAGSMASSEALNVISAEWTGYPDDWDIYTALPEPALAVSVDFWPIGAALGFAALAAVFRYGGVLQRDTETARVNGSEDEGPAGVHCRLDELLEARGMTLTRLSELVGVSVVNLSILKNDRARAIRYSTLAAICAALDCEVGELLVRAD